jgi:hypothetical protein
VCASGTSYGAGGDGKHLVGHGPVAENPSTNAAPCAGTRMMTSMKKFLLIALVLGLLGFAAKKVIDNA